MKLEPEYDVLIAGGGLAGLCSAIDLASKGISVLLVEKDSYPRHRVCGEYVSNETLPYLSSLGVDPLVRGAVPIDELEFAAPDGQLLRVHLPLGGFGISRYRLDHLLMERAIEAGAAIHRGVVEDITFEQNGFRVDTKNNEIFRSRFVIGSYGKRSVLDRKLGRRFIRRKSSHVAVKAHYRGQFPSNRVGLYNFKGGYCGVSNIENNHLNICYIADYDVFQRHKSIDGFEKEVLLRHEPIREILADSEMLFERPLSISQVSFDKKELLVDHVLMCGDSAGLIHPLCGNGMGMAIGGARLVSESIGAFYDGELTTRIEVEENYKRAWQREFSSRLRSGRILAGLLRKKELMGHAMPLLRNFPVLMHQIISTTHGKLVPAR